MLVSQIERSLFLHRAELAHAGLSGWLATGDITRPCCKMHSAAPWYEQQPWSTAFGKGSVPEAKRLDRIGLDFAPAALNVARGAMYRTGP
jgi:hypothetical protein